MKRTLVQLLPAVIGLASLLSCSKAEGGDSRADGLIEFEADGIGAFVDTKAAPVTSLSEFYVTCLRGGSSIDVFMNSRFSRSGSVYSSDRYWPVSDAAYSFYASSVPGVTLSAGRPVKVVDDIRSVDLLMAVEPSPAFRQRTVLNFRHVAARIGRCTISAPAGYTVSGLKVKITPYLSGTYDLLAGRTAPDASRTAWSGLAEGAAVTLASAVGSAADNDLWLIPGDYILTATYTLTRGAYTESFTRLAQICVEAGKVNNISATLPNGWAEELLFRVSLAPWGNNTLNVDVE